jgi:hypothetical protein
VIVQRPSGYPYTPEISGGDEEQKQNMHILL